MNKVFDYDGSLMTAINRFASLMWLGILTMVFCIPVVTAGASITAMYYTVFRMRDRDKGYVFENFWHGFRENFLRATAFWLLILAGFCVLYGDFVILTKSVYTFPMLYRVLTGLVAFIFVMTTAFVFPLQARFENTWKQVWKNSFLMALFHLPKTVLIVFLHVVPYLILYIYPVSYPAVLVLGLSVPAYFNAALFLRIFETYAPSETDPEEEVKWTAEETEESLLTQTGWTPGAKI